jgi:hypothetical protein
MGAERMCTDYQAKVRTLQQPALASLQAERISSAIQVAPLPKLSSMLPH